MPFSSPDHVLLQRPRPIPQVCKLERGPRNFLRSWRRLFQGRLRKSCCNHNLFPASGVHPGKTCPSVPIVGLLLLSCSISCSSIPPIKIKNPGLGLAYTQVRIYEGQDKRQLPYPLRSFLVCGHFAICVSVWPQSFDLPPDFFFFSFAISNLLLSISTQICVLIYFRLW